VGGFTKHVNRHYILGIYILLASDCMLAMHPLANYLQSGVSA
jgi:hypothetical protein